MSFGAASFGTVAFGAAPSAAPSANTYTLTAEAGTVAIAGTATGLAFNRTLIADAGSAGIAGADATLAFNRKLIADTANVPLAGADAGLAFNRKLTADTTAFAISGNPATLTYTTNGFTYTLVADAGALGIVGQDARLSWSGESTGFSNEIELKRWYIKRKKQILVFNSAQEADSYIESIEQAEKAIQEAQKTSRRARQRLRKKIVTVEPIESVDIELLTDAVKSFAIPVDLPALIQAQDYERVMQILAMARDMQEEEDLEMLLLA